MAIRLLTTGSRDLDRVLLSVLERFASNHGLSGGDAGELVGAVGRAVDGVRSGDCDPVRVALGRVADALEIEIDVGPDGDDGATGDHARVVLSRPLGPGRTGDA